MTSSISQPVLYPKLPDHPEYYTAQEAYELGHDHGVESRDTQFAEMVATITAVKALHQEKHGQNLNGAYVICAYDKTPWPCKTFEILSLPDMSVASRAIKFPVWTEGYIYGYAVGVQEGQTGKVVEYAAPNPYDPALRGAAAIVLADGNARMSALEKDAVIADAESDRWDGTVDSELAGYAASTRIRDTIRAVKDGES